MMMMMMWLRIPPEFLVFFFLLLLLGCLSLKAGGESAGYGVEGASVWVRGSNTIAQTEDPFVCTTLDWWPPEKCNYGSCPWGQSSVLNLDLSSPPLANAIRAFGNLRIRIGGSLQDQVDYGVEDLGSQCLPFQKQDDGLFGFSRGCLTMERWNELNQLFQRTGALITFGLNALHGRHQVSKGVWGGAWNSSNAEAFMKYTIEKGYDIDSWEFGNELSGSGVAARVSVEQYAADVVRLKSLIGGLYGSSQSKPLLLAPGGFFDQQWYSQLLQDSGPHVLNVLTHHIYNLGAGVDPNLMSKILNPSYLSLVAKTFNDLQLTIQNSGPWASAWVGESGGAYNSGGHLISNTFVDSFWFLDQLGMAASYNTKVYCRQALVGGHYSLLNTSTLAPNPDYFSALLWHRLMGKGVLSAKVVGSPYLRAYAHCSKNKGGITVLLINLSNSTTFDVNVENNNNVNLDLSKVIPKRNSLLHRLRASVAWVGKLASTGNEQRYEYHLSPEDGYLRSQNMLLNGKLLELNDIGEVPALEPAFVNAQSPVIISPLSIAFIVFPNFVVDACS